MEKQVSNVEKEQSLIGRAIRKRFGRKYFFGTIDSYDSECNWYKVCIINSIRTFMNVQGYLVYFVSC